MGKRVLAAFGVVAPMDGLLASGLSAAPTSADAATSSTAERTGSSEEAPLRALYWQAVAEGGRLVVFTGGDRSGQDDYLKNAFAKTFPKTKVAVPEPAAVQGRAGARHRARTDVAPPAGRKGIFDHATTDPLGLGQFMSDRAALDRYEARLSLYIGDAHGANSSDPTSSAPTRSTSRAPKAEPLLDRGCPPRPGSRRTPRREAISPTITLHPRKHA